MRILVTGAGGFIGRAVTARAVADGDEVIGVDTAPAPPGSPARWVRGDITTAGSWQEAAAGCELVLHTAAVVSNAMDTAGQWQVNVLGTRRVLDAARDAGCGRVVLFSSVRAFGDSGFPDGVPESWPVRPQGIPYVDTKIAAEQVALQAHAAGEVAVTVLRPADVYGPGSRPWVLLPLEAARAGRLVLPASGRGVFSPLYIDDLVAGALGAGRSPACAGQVLTLAAGGVSCAQYFGWLAGLVGGRVRCVATPVAVAAARAAGGLERLRGRPSELNAVTVRYFARTATYSAAKAERLLGWQPQVGLAEGQRRTAAWLEGQGLLATG